MVSQLFNQLMDLAAALDFYNDFASIRSRDGNSVEIAEIDEDVGRSDCRAPCMLASNDADVSVAMPRKNFQDLRFAIRLLNDIRSKLNVMAEVSYKAV